MNCSITSSTTNDSPDALVIHGPLKISNTLLYCSRKTTMLTVCMFSYDYFKPP